MTALISSIVAFIVAGLAVFGFVPHQQSQPIPQLPQQVVQQSTNAVSKTSPQLQTPTGDLQTYTNSQYGFSLQYPASVTVNPPCSMGVCPSNPLITFYEKDNRPESTFNDGYVYVFASTDSDAIASCAKNSSPFGTSATTINGIPFVISKGPPDAGMGQSHSHNSYETLISGICYRMVLDVNFWDGIPNNPGHGESDLESILHSFRLIGSGASISVPGMSKYTDQEFGFSFWYPSGWTVSNPSQQPVTDRVGNSVVGQIKVSGDGSIITIDKIHSTNLAYNVNPGACGYCGPLTYFFDPNKHLWMKKYPAGINGGDVSSQQANTISGQPADVSRNTMGGLHMFSSEQKENATIIPLSAQNFLFVKGVTYTDACGPSCASPEVKGNALFLAKTVVATDPSVATPVSANEQITVIQAEKDAYAPSVKSTGNEDTLDFHSSRQSGTVPLSNQYTWQLGTQKRAAFTVDFGDGSSCTGYDCVSDVWSPDTQFPTLGLANHQYKSPGTYTVRLLDSDNATLARFTVTTFMSKADMTPVSMWVSPVSGSAPLVMSIGWDGQDNSVTEYSVDFGDGRQSRGTCVGVSSTVNPVSYLRQLIVPTAHANTLLAPACKADHTFTAAGTYTVRLLASDGSVAGSVTVTAK